MIIIIYVLENNCVGGLIWCKELIVSHNVRIVHRNMLLYIMFKCACIFSNCCAIKNHVTDR